MKVETAGTQDNGTLIQLLEEHRRYSEMLDGLSQTPYLSAEDHMEELRLKKLKLRVKDEIVGNRPYRFN